MDAGDAAGAGGIDDGVGEGDAAIFEVAGDVDEIAGVGAEASGGGEHFKEGLVAFELADAGGVDGSKDGYGLAAEGGERDRYLGIFHYGEVGFDFGFEGGGGEAGGVDVTGDREGEVAGGIDAEGFVGEFVGEVGDEDGELVAGAEEVGGGGWGLGVEVEG